MKRVPSGAKAHPRALDPSSGRSPQASRPADLTARGSPAGRWMWLARVLSRHETATSLRQFAMLAVAVTPVRDIALRRGDEDLLEKSRANGVRIEESQTTAFRHPDEIPRILSVNGLSGWTFQRDCEPGKHQSPSRTRASWPREAPHLSPDRSGRPGPREPRLRPEGSPAIDTSSPCPPASVGSQPRSRAVPATSAWRYPPRRSGPASLGT